MISRTTIAVTWLWVAALFIATVGVSGQQIYCYCVGKTTLSLFSAADACAEMQGNRPGNCCSDTRAKLLHSCCEKNVTDKGPKGCTQKTTKVFQLKTEFTVQEKLFEKFALLTLAFPPATAPFYVSAAKMLGVNIGFPTYAQPPPLHGRMMCVRYGVFRC